MEIKNNSSNTSPMFPPRKGSFTKSENQDDDETFSNLKSLSICSDTPFSRSVSFLKITRAQKSAYIYFYSKIKKKYKIRQNNLNDMN